MLVTRRSDPLYFDPGSPAERAYEAAEIAAYTAMHEAPPERKEEAWREAWRRLEPTWRNALGLHTRAELDDD